MTPGLSNTPFSPTIAESSKPKQTLVRSNTAPTKTEGTHAKTASWPVHSSANEAARLGIEPLQASSQIRKHPETTEALTMIAQGQYDDAKTVIDGLLAKSQGKELKRWAADADDTISGLQKLPEESRSIVSRLVGNVADHNLHGVYESLNEIRSDLHGLQAGIDAFRTLLEPFGSADNIAATTKSLGRAGRFSNEQCAILENLASGDWTGAAENLTKLTTVTPTSDSNTHGWIGATAELVSLLEVHVPAAVADDFKIVVSHVKTNNLHAAYEQLIAGGNKLSGKGSHDASGEWTEAVTKFIGHWGQCRPAFLERQRLEIVKCCLSGDREAANGKLSSYLQNLSTSPGGGADADHVGDPGGTWAHSARTLINAMGEHGALQRAGNETTLHKLDELKPISTEGCLKTAEALERTYLEVAESLNRVTRPFGKQETPQVLEEMQKAAIARNLALGEVEDAKTLLMQLTASTDFVDSSKDWVRQCGSFIASLERDIPTPRHLAKEEKTFNDLVREGKPTEAEAVLKTALATPQSRASNSEAMTEWAARATKSIYFIAVPLLLDRINDELENNDLSQALKLAEELGTFQEDEKRDVGLSATVAEIIGKIKGAQQAKAGSEVAPVPLRPSKEPKNDADFQRGFFLNEEGTAIINADGTDKFVDEVTIDPKKRTVFSISGDYLGHYSSERGDRLHADNKWLDRLPVVMSVPRTDELLQSLAEAINLVEETPSRQNTLEENMNTLKRLKEQARGSAATTLKKGFNMKRAGKILWDDLNFGEIVDSGLAMIALNGRNFRSTPGQLLNKYGKTAKKIVFSQPTGVKDEYRITLDLLKTETRTEVKKLYPGNQEFCQQMQEMIAAEIAKLPAEVPANDFALQQIDGMFEWHQRVLSLNHNFPIPVEKDEELFTLALSEVPVNKEAEAQSEAEESSASSDAETDAKPDDKTKTRSDSSSKASDQVRTSAKEEDPAKINFAKDEVSLAYSKYINGNSPSAKAAPKKQSLLFHGTGGTGKSYDCRRMGYRVFDQGKYTTEFLPKYYSFGRLIKSVATDETPQVPRNRFEWQVQYEPWSLPVEDAVGALIEAKLKGFRIFIFEEGEKLILPDDDKEKNAAPSRRKEKDKNREVNGVVKYILDRDTENLPIRLGPLTFYVPWNRDMVLFNSNKNINKLGLAPEELRALLRRFDAKIHYERASDPALQGAFGQAMDNALDLEKDTVKAQAIKDYFIEKSISDDIIQAGISKAGHDLVTPDTIRDVTEKIVHNILQELKEVPSEEAKDHIEMRHLTHVIEGNWKRTEEKYALDDDASTRSPSPRMPPPPPMLSHLLGYGRGLRHLDPNDLAVPRAICMEALRGCNGKLSDDDADKMFELFTESNCINEIIKRFNKNYIRNRLFVKQRFIDREVLRQCVKAAHGYFMDNHAKSDFNPQSVLSEVHKVFQESRRLMQQTDKQRAVCNTTLKELNTGLKRDDTLKLREVFLEGNFLPMITRYFGNLRFSNEGILQDATRVAHSECLKELRKNGLENFDFGAVASSINAFFEKASEKNEETISISKSRGKNDKYYDEISSSAMTDSEDDNAKKARKKTKLGQTSTETPADDSAKSKTDDAKAKPAEETATA